MGWVLWLLCGSQRGRLAWDPDAWGMPVSCPLPLSAPGSQHHLSVFLYFSPNSGHLVREKRHPVRRTPGAVLASAFLPRLCSPQGCSARCLHWERWRSAWQVSGAGGGFAWSVRHHPEGDVLNATFIPTKLPLSCGSWWQHPQGVSPVFVVLQLPRASPHGCDGFWYTRAPLVAGDATSRALQLNGETVG